MNRERPALISSTDLSDADSFVLFRHLSSFGDTETLLPVQENAPAAERDLKCNLKTGVPANDRENTKRVVKFLKAVYESHEPYSIAHQVEGSTLNTFLVQVPDFGYVKSSVDIVIRPESSGMSSTVPHSGSSMMDFSMATITLKKKALWQEPDAELNSKMTETLRTAFVDYALLSVVRAKCYPHYISDLSHGALKVFAGKKVRGQPVVYYQVLSQAQFVHELIHYRDHRNKSMAPEVRATCVKWGSRLQRPRKTKVTASDDAAPASPAVELKVPAVELKVPEIELKAPSKPKATPKKRGRPPKSTEELVVSSPKKKQKAPLKTPLENLTSPTIPDDLEAGSASDSDSF
ncbi:MAG: uncharacterized protein KVP18_000435 [Porospora cf. gigantea A]|uniref:uncharacterized protein n=1 Tax=Porospora cf. gigantea A TaxID=2853593 RepID=UPI00355AB2CC|nr:MAG: hypothetical protein KVP18_000435 [Porospora cf. gigantea A]